MDTTKKFIAIRNGKLGQKIVASLKARHFDAYYFDDASGATDKILELVPSSDVVSWGGSMTIDALGIKEKLSGKGCAFIDRDTGKTPEERVELMRKSLTCDTFLSSTNAISEDGELVNVDGNGNRVAAMLFGPKQVIIVMGMNKVAHTLQDAYTRARTVASPLNNQRFGGKTPCFETGECRNCKSADSTCSFIVTMRLCKPAHRIKVILIGQDLGF
jgi:L-lactate utilization protein LutB